MSARLLLNAPQVTAASSAGTNHCAMYSLTIVALPLKSGLTVGVMMLTPFYAFLLKVKAASKYVDVPVSINICLCFLW